jgi:hypothetical protein
VEPLDAAGAAGADWRHADTMDGLTPAKAAEVGKTGRRAGGQGGQARAWLVTMDGMVDGDTGTHGEIG